MIALAEEGGEVGGEVVDELGEVIGVGIGEDKVDVLLDGGEAGVTEEFGEAGLDEFLFAFVEVDAAVLVDGGGDSLEVTRGQELRGQEGHRGTPGRKSEISGHRKSSGVKSDSR
jgi:hypothetical protein